MNVMIWLSIVGLITVATGQDTLESLLQEAEDEGAAVVAIIDSVQEAIPVYVSAVTALQAAADQFDAIDDVLDQLADIKTITRNLPDTDSTESGEVVSRIDEMIAAVRETRSQIRISRHRTREAVPDVVENTMSVLEEQRGILHPEANVCSPVEDLPDVLEYQIIGEKCYFYIREEGNYRSFDDARSYCQDHGADLVTAPTEESMDILRTFFSRLGDQGYLNFWLGATRSPQDDLFYWVTGEALENSDPAWYVNQPTPVDGYDYAYGYIIGAAEFTLVTGQSGMVATDLICTM